MGGEREVGCFLVLQILLQPVFLLPILQIRLCYVGGGGEFCAVPDLENLWLLGTRMGRSSERA